MDNSNNETVILNKVTTKIQSMQSGAG